MADVLKVSIIGDTASGEVWSVNPVFAFNASPQAVTYADCLAIATAVDALTVPANLLNKMNPAQRVTGCRVEARDFNGDLEAIADHARTTPASGTGAGSHPQQVAMVFSLRTGTPGPRGRGRLFWPATAMPLTGGTLRVGTSDVTATLTAIKDYLVLIRTAVNAQLPGMHLAVWSRTSANSALVTKILAGDILDVQRRRRDRLKENYTELAMPAAVVA